MKCNAGDPGSIPRSGRLPGEGNGNPLQYSCLEISMDREAWLARAHKVVKTEYTCTRMFFFFPWKLRDGVISIPNMEI